MPHTYPFRPAEIRHIPSSNGTVTPSLATRGDATPTAHRRQAVPIEQRIGQRLDGVLATVAVSRAKTRGASELCRPCCGGCSAPAAVARFRFDSVFFAFSSSQVWVSFSREATKLSFPSLPPASVSLILSQLAGSGIGSRIVGESEFSTCRLEVNR